MSRVSTVNRMLICLPAVLIMLQLSSCSSDARNSAALVEKLSSVLEGNDAPLDFFNDEGCFVYKQLRISAGSAISTYRRKQIYTYMYTIDKEIVSETLRVIHCIGWTRINTMSYELTIDVYCEKNEAIWKIQRVEGDSELYRKIFFEK